MFDFSPLILTFKLALVTTVVLFLIGLPLACWLAFTSNKARYIIEPLVSMPLVLPPTVIGFYLLMFFTSSHLNLAFTFIGLVIGSVLFSLPFMVNPIKAGLQSFPKSLIEASYALGKCKRQTLLKVILPNIKPSIWTGIIMAFAHTVGEFGVVLMVGGSIPGQTRTASIAIFSEMEALNYHNAYAYSGVLFILAFAILFILNFVNRKGTQVVS
jgi:molybdate transport system permease protein